jgi:hypothetical protein
MMKARVFAGLLVLGAWAAGASATTTIFTDQSDFVSLLRPDYYLQSFDGYTDGHPHGNNLVRSATYTQGGATPYSFTLATNTDGDYSHYLWSVPGAESVSNSQDTLIVTFGENRLPYAVGGNFYTTDLFGGTVTGFEVVITLSDGTFRDFRPAGASDFTGFTSTTPIVSLSVSPGVDSTGNTAFPTVDDLYVGSPIPEPLTMTAAGLGIGAVGVYIRRRRQGA